MSSTHTNNHFCAEILSNLICCCCLILCQSCLEDERKNTNRSEREQLLQKERQQRQAEQIQQVNSEGKKNELSQQKNANQVIKPPKISSKNTKRVQTVDQSTQTMDFSPEITFEYPQMIDQNPKVIYIQPEMKNQNI